MLLRLGQEHEVSYEAKLDGLSKIKVKGSVMAVGNSRSKVGDQLRKLKHRMILIEGSLFWNKCQNWVFRYRDRGVSIGHGRDGEHGDFSDFFTWPTKWQSSAQPVRRDLILTPREAIIIGSSTQHPGDPERRAGPDQNVDYAGSLSCQKRTLSVSKG